MEKVDRLGWAAGICGVAYGRRIGIRANHSEVLERLSDRLPCGWRPAASPVVDELYSLVVGGERSRPNIRRFNLAYVGAMQLARTMDLNEALDLIESDLHLRIAERARGRVFVHAGVVGWRDRAIVIPGRTFSGKTTLVAALVRAGRPTTPTSLRSWMRPAACIRTRSHCQCAGKGATARNGSRWSRWAPQSAPSRCLSA